MKKPLLFLAAIAFVGFLKAQSSFQVTELVGGNAAQSHYVFNTDTTNINSPTELLEFKIKNISGSNKLTKIRKAITYLATNTITATNHDIYFCYNQTCYTPYTNYSVANIAAGAALPNGGGTYGLRTEYDHVKVIGTSVVRYTIYDSTNTADSVNITITYNVSGVNSIKNMANSIFLSNASPNPATNAVNFTYDFSNLGSDASIKIYNLLGNLVKTVILNPSLKSTQIDVSILEEGFYFYTLIANGRNSATRKFVVSR